MAAHVLSAGFFLLSDHRTPNLQPATFSTRIGAPGLQISDLQARSHLAIKSAFPHLSLILSSKQCTLNSITDQPPIPPSAEFLTYHL